MSYNIIMDSTYCPLPRNPSSLAPIIDPSELTTQQLRREISIVQREIESAQGSNRNDLNALKELMGMRLEAIEVATLLRKDDVNKIPSEIKSQVDGLRHLQDEKFTSIAQQFNERDVRSDQATSSGAQALAAALQAAKELVGAQGEASAAAAVKSETSFTKQIDQIGTIIQTLEKALDARITELKERIDRGEGNSQGVAANKTGLYALAGFILTALVIINMLAANGVLGGK